MEKLYERGVPEYLSIPLSCEHLTYVQEHNPKVRECLADGILEGRRETTYKAWEVEQGNGNWSITQLCQYDVAAAARSKLI